MSGSFPRDCFGPVSERADSASMGWVDLVLSHFRLAELKTLINNVMIIKTTKRHINLNTHPPTYMIMSISKQAGGHSTHQTFFCLCE